MKKLNYLILGLLLAAPLGASALSALSTYITAQGGTGTTTPSGILYGDNGATSHLNTVIIGTNLTFSGGTLSATGASGLSTSTPIAASNLLVYSTSGAGSAFGVATSTLTPSSPLTGSFTQIGSGGTLGINTSGTWSGNAGTASALAADGTNCSAGNYPLGVDAAGNVQNCTTASTGTVATSSQETAGRLSYWTTTNGYPALLSSVATTTLSTNNGLTISAGAGALVGGSNATIGLSTINAGVLGAVTNGSVPTSQATSTLYGTGTNGFVLSEVGGVPTWVATTTFTGSGPISTAFAAGQVTVSCATCLTANQSITLSGVVAGSGSTAITTTFGSAANGVLANPASGSAVPSFVATSTLKIALSDTTGTLTVDRGGTGQATFTASQLLYGNGTNALSSVATTSHSFSGPFSISGTLGALVGGLASTVTWTGLATTSAISTSQVLYGTSASGVASVATSSLAVSGPFSISGTLGALVGGAASTVTYTGVATSSALTTNNVLYATSVSGIATAGMTYLSGLPAFGIGTTTPHFTLSISSSTPQLSLNDATGVNSPWNFRAVNGVLYIATSSPTTFATTTVAALTIDVNGFIVDNAIRAASGNNCLQTDTAGKISSTGSACAAGGTPGGTPGQVQYNSANATFAGVSTSTLSVSGPFSLSNTLGALVGGANTTITYTGISTTSAISTSQLLYATSASGVASVATTSLSVNNGLTISASAGALVGGSAATIGLATINAGVLGAVVTGAVPTSQATSTLYLGTAGQVLAFTGGVIKGVATTTAGTGLSYDGTSFNVNSSQSIATLSNLGTNGYLKTSGGVGTLGVQAVPIPYSDGGTNATTAWTAGSVLFGGASAFAQDNANFFYNSAIPGLGLGTTTGRWALTIASSTRPQLVLTDASSVNSPWTFRSTGGSFFLATSSPTTFATSTAPAIYIDTNGHLVVPKDTGFSNNVAQGVATTTYFGGTIDKSFVLSSSTLDIAGNIFASATSTFLAWNPYKNATLIAVYCKTDVGTLLVDIGRGNATSTQGGMICNTTGTSSTTLTTTGYLSRANVYIAAGSATTTKPNILTITATWADTSD